MTLEQLSEAWQSLRNAIVGRSGFEQKVPPELVSRFLRAYESWLKWYADAGPLDETKGSFGEADKHIAALRELAREAAKHGVRPEVALAETPSEAVKEAVKATFGIVIGVGVAAAGVLAFTALKNRGGR